MPISNQERRVSPVIRVKTLDDLERIMAGMFIINNTRG